MLTLSVFCIIIIKKAKLFVSDTGIYCGNEDFLKKTQGTCTLGVDFVDGSNVDGNGHGTHWLDHIHVCYSYLRHFLSAGTVAGFQWGVGKEANLIAVRVLDNNGSGTLDDVIAGIDWYISD